MSTELLDRPDVEAAESDAVRFRVGGMDCAACAATVAKVVEAVDGVETAEVSIGNGTMRVEGSAPVRTARQIAGLRRCCREKRCC